MAPSNAKFLPCQHCGTMFERASTRGRTPQFCGRRCRTAAERVRTTTRPSAVHDFDNLVVRGTEQVLQQLQRVRRVAKEADPRNWSTWQTESMVSAGAVLEQVVALQNEVEALMGLAVLQARGRRMTWPQITTLTGVGTNRARELWDVDRVMRTWNRRHELRAAARTRARERYRPRVSLRVDEPVEAQVGQQPQRPEHRPEEQLRMALSYLHRTSGRSMRSLAKEIGVSPSYVARLVSGERIPPWDVAADMVEACGGQPSQVRPLWDEIHGRRPASPVFPEQQGAVDQAAGELKDALRGLHLAGACPPPETVAERRPGTLTGDQVADLIDDAAQSEIPAWPVVKEVVAALHGRPETIRPLWERLKVADDPTWTPATAC